ncbi:PorP/SprF family type IX secretion system membrane protein [Mucilaginibacter flavidus]|uniref:PorP/SprF family type IX secretion system membrane protein n=1 Tax=Mucilaginibacter flavidus TaxID=2949309 RepID=UPI0020923738|nr:type IX secretion system membrane protein PorP/SprF [Mucilaginibacter flavidus]
MKKIIVFISVILMAVGSAKGQIDPHFSQYYAYPLWLNPALTGVFDGDLRINANAKNQWNAIPGGFKTGGISMDFKAGEKSGLGLNIINQAAGTAGWNYFAAYASYSYGFSVSDDETKKLRFGLQAGIINRSFDPSRLQFDDQYNPVIGYDPTAASFETFATTSATVFDASAGVFYYDGDPTHPANFFGGVSVAHLTSPKDPFTNGGSITSKLPMRFTAHAGVKIKASDDFDVIPHAVYISQQGNAIKALGVYSEMKFQDDNGLILGGMYRIGDAAVADVGYHLKNMVIGVSYDFNTSAFKNATSGQGGFELSISYVFKHTTNPSVVCPKF